MNIVKHEEFFNPIKVTTSVHIIGCGSVGSELANQLARLGIEDFILYDFDVVESHNIANQCFIEKDIGSLKTEATEKIIKSINPSAKVTRYDEGWNGQNLFGFVFLAVDNIDLRRKICEKNKFNRSIKAVFDFRTRLTDAQHYGADWSSMDQINNMLESMNFTHEEAQIDTPKTACGTELGLKVVVDSCCIIGICNFINFINNNVIKNVVVINPFENILF